MRIEPVLAEVGELLGILTVKLGLPAGRHAKQAVRGKKKVVKHSVPAFRIGI
jgi:hypothetical protein